MVKHLSVHNSMVHFQALFSLLRNHQKGQSKQTTAIIKKLWLGLGTLYYLSQSRRLNLSRASWHDHQLQKQDVIILETCPLLSSDYTVDKSRNLFFYYGNFCNSNFHNVVQIILKNASLRMSTVENLSITLIRLHSRQEHRLLYLCYKSSFSFEMYPCLHFKI